MKYILSEIAWPTTHYLVHSSYICYQKIDNIPTIGETLGRVGHIMIVCVINIVVVAVTIASIIIITIIITTTTTTAITTINITIIILCKFDVMATRTIEQSSVLSDFTKYISYVLCKSGSSNIPSQMPFLQGVAITTRSIIIVNDIMTLPCLVFRQGRLCLLVL